MFLNKNLLSKYNGYMFFSGIFVVLFSWMIFGTVPLLMVFLYKNPEMPINKNLFLFLILLGFLVALLVLLVFVKKVHKIGIIEIFTSRKRIDFNRILYAFVTWSFIFAIFFVVDYLTGGYNLQFDLFSFLVLLLLSLSLLPIQVLFEEVFFRGYLLQGIAKITGSRLVTFLVCSLSFGLFHSFNSEITNLGWSIMIVYIGMGFLLTAIAMLDEGLELSIGIHFANNFLAFLLISYDWASIETDAIFSSNHKPMLWEIIITVFLIYPLYFSMLSKKYGWKSIKEKLFGRLNSA